MRSKPLRDFRNSKARRLYICKRKFSSQKSASPAGAFAAGALQGETGNRTSGALGFQKFGVLLGAQKG
ncbi:MAG: hypothetical protein DMG17_26045 [Acidobacteria bacterium]|nr:MAG: hypothetical protein DMG17_26045 [Acidobacteriota bacterium]